MPQIAHRSGERQTLYNKIRPTVNKAVETKCNSNTKREMNRESYWPIIATTMLSNKSHHNSWLTVISIYLWFRCLQTDWGSLDNWGSAWLHWLLGVGLVEVCPVIPSSRTSGPHTGEAVLVALEEAQEGKFCHQAHAKAKLQV